VKVLTTVKDVVKALREGKVVRRIYPMDNTVFEFVRVHNGVYEYKNPYHPEWDSCLDQPPQASLEDWAIFNLNWPCLLHPEDQ